MKRIIPAFMLSLAMLSAWAPAQETVYTPRTGNGGTETTYNARPPRTDSLLPGAKSGDTETRYNPAGTLSDSKIGFLSTRRDDPEYPNFLVSMQRTSMDLMKSPMNVAPLSATSLADQANALAERGVEVYIVDSPNPLDAKDFFQNSAFLKRKGSLVAKTMASGFYPPEVVDTPVLYGERVGEEAIRRVGNVDVQVGYILEQVDDKLPIDGQKDKVLETFNRPFDNVAKNIERVKIDPATYQKGLSSPAVVCVLTEQDSKKWAGKLRGMFPDAVLIAVGESKEVIDAYTKGQIDIRIRPDYVRILQNAISEANQKSQMPIVLHPAADINWANLAKAKEKK